MIECKNFSHGAVINDLAKAGVISPVAFRVSAQGFERTYIANSCWAATDFLKEQGFYARRADGTPEFQIEWGLEQGPRLGGKSMPAA